MSPTDFKLFSIDADGEPDFSNTGPTEPPSRERVLAAVQSAFARPLVPRVHAPVMSVELFERGKREGWIVQRDGAWVIDWSKA